MQPPNFGKLLVMIAITAATVLSAVSIKSKPKTRSEIYAAVTRLITDMPLDFDLNDIIDMTPSLNGPILEYHCWRGTLCTITIPDEIDEFEHVVVLSKTATLFVQPWEDYEPDEFHNVLMEIGTFNYVWAFTKLDGSNSYFPFRVHIKSLPAPNHLFSITVLSPTKEEFESDTFDRLTLLSNFALSVDADMETISIFDFQELNSKTTVSLFLNNVTIKTCAMEQLEAVQKMIFGPTGKKPSSDFLRNMDHSLHVRNAYFLPKGSCLGATTTPVTRTPVISAVSL